MLYADNFAIVVVTNPTTMVFLTMFRVYFKGARGGGAFAPPPGNLVAPARNLLVLKEREREKEM